MKTAILFAGQGSQAVGMGRDFYEQCPEFKEVFDLLPEAQRKIAFEGPEEDLKATVNTQPILLAFALGVYNVLKSRGLVQEPAMAAGLSLGEYSALAAAGVWDAATALELIRFRAEQMTRASEGVDTVMSAVIGLSGAEVQAICDQVSSGKVAESSGVAESDGLGYHVEAANFNCPGQVVISGEEAGVTEAEELAKAAGARRCMRLPVSGPFHTSYMRPAGEALEEKFKDYEFGEMAFPVVFNCLGTAKADAESIQELLVMQVSSSVYMEDSIRYMEDQGITHIIEIGPGKALSGFVRKTTKNIAVMNVDQVADLERVKEWIEKQQ